MPDKQFLETYSLYRPFDMRVPETLDDLSKPTIKMACSACGSDQTYVMINEYYDGKGYTNYPSAGEVVQAVFLCAGCQKSKRTFYLHIHDDRNGVTKVGQYPAWDISGNRQVERLLGEHKSYLRRGLICESQGYGIAAFAYYRRIVEETIDKLLDEVTELLDGGDLERYREALALTKTTRVTSEKIDIIKDLIPPVLRPQGMNPLRTLHETLSEGLHARSDEECLSSAEVVRAVLTFLATQIAASAEAKKSFTSGMRALLDKKSKAGKQTI